MIVEILREKYDEISSRNKLENKARKKDMGSYDWPSATARGPIGPKTPEPPRWPSDWLAVHVPKSGPMHYKTPHGTSKRQVCPKLLQPCCTFWVSVKSERLRVCCILLVSWGLSFRISKR